MVGSVLDSFGGVVGMWGSSGLVEQPRKPAGSAEGGRYDLGVLTAGTGGQEAFPSPYTSVPASEFQVGVGGPGIVTTGKSGDGAPPLVVNVQQRGAAGRFYALTPQVKEQLESGVLDVYDALDRRVAFPSITTCLGALDKPALPAWAAGLAGQKAESVLSELVALQPDERQQRLEELLRVEKNGRTVVRNLAARAHTVQRDSAAGRGTTVHALIEERILGGTPEIPAHLSGYMDAATGFMRDHPGIRFTATEMTVHHESAAVMGTTDGVVQFGSRTYVLDWKTNDSAKVYATTGMQLAAAANADVMVFPDGGRAAMPKVDAGIAVGLAPNGKYEVYEFDVSAAGAHHQGFLAARAAWAWTFTAGKTPKPSRLRS